MNALLPYVAAKIVLIGLLSVIPKAHIAAHQENTVVTIAGSVEAVYVKPTPAKPVFVPRVQPTVKLIARPVVKTDIRTLIINAASKYGLSSKHMLDIATCESGFNPGIVNPHHVYVHGVDYGTAKGVYQYLDSTWLRMSGQAGYGGYSVFNAYANVNVAAWAFSHGHSSEWECK